MLCLGKKIIEHIQSRSVENPINRNECDAQGRICSFMALNIFFVFLTNLAYILEPFTHVPYTIVSYTTKAFIGVFFLTLLSSFAKKIRADFLLFFICILLFFLINYVAFPELNEFQNDTNKAFFLFCLPSFIVAQYVEDYHVFYKKVVFVSYVIATLSAGLLFFYFLGILNVYEMGMYFMGLGYSMLIPACICMTDFVLNKHVISGISFLILCIAILLIGSRGPLLSIFVMIVFVLLCKMKKVFFSKQRISIFDFVKKYIGVILLIMLLIILVNVLGNFSNESRNIQLLFSGDINGHSSGRSEIHDALLSEFFLDLISIRGLNAEYLAVKGYAHSTIIELLYQFGAIIGGGIIVLILLRAYKTIKSFRENERSFAVVVYMICALCTLLNSQSLWDEWTFWGWIAMTFNLKDYEV